MKTKNIFFYLILLLVVSTSACVKDPIEPTPVDDVGNYVSKFYSLTHRVANSPTLDTSLKTNFFYDGLKRISNIIDTSKDINSSSISISRSLFFYNGSDSFPNKYNLTSFTPNSNRRDTINSFYFYNGLGKLVIDSTIQSSSTSLSPSFPIYSKTKRIYSYSYAGNKIFRLMLSTPLQTINTTSSPYSVKDTFTLDSRGNVTEHRSYGLNSRYVVQTYTYGDNPSPFANITGGSLLFLTGNSNVLLAAKNNVLASRVVTTLIGSINPPQVGGFDYTGGYTFNTNGYPKIANSIFPYSPGFRGSEIYFYTTL
jgi:hypothetical protein